MRCSSADRLWHLGIHRGSTGDGKREGGPRSVIRFSPEATLMSLDDGAADGQPYPHTVALCGVQGVEQIVRALAVEAGASIPHGHTDMIAVLSLGPDQQCPRAI